MYIACYEILTGVFGSSPVKSFQNFPTILAFSETFLFIFHFSLHLVLYYFPLVFSFSFVFLIINLLRFI